MNRLNHLVVPETQVVFRVDSGFLTISAIQVFNDANLITALALRAAAIASTLSSPGEAGLDSNPGGGLTSIKLDGLPSSQLIKIQITPTRCYNYQGSVFIEMQYEIA